MNFLKIFLMLFAGIFFMGCATQVPKLEKMHPTVKSNSRYVSALEDMNTILEVYLPPNFNTQLYHIKSIKDSTGISKTTEIPPDITPLVRDALSQIHYKIRHVELYDQEDITHISAEDILKNVNRLNLNIVSGERRTPDFTIVGNISQFDRNLTSTSNNGTARGSVGGGTKQADLSASSTDASNLSRLGVSFSVYDRNGISVPERFGATVDVSYAKNGVDIGFAILGAGIGFGTESTSMHGRHYALQMLAELSIIQIVGRTMTIPYWRVAEDLNIFKEDPIVLDLMREEYLCTVNDDAIVAFTQMQCIANGDFSVSVTGAMDQTTIESISHFADKYGVKNRKFPNFELYSALELNRILDTSVSSRAWSAYNAFKAGQVPSTQPAQVHHPSQTQPAATHASAPKKGQGTTMTRPSTPDTSSQSYEKSLEDLL